VADYRSQADALDAEILRAIAHWSNTSSRDLDFNTPALRIFEHQLRYNEPYARYCAWLGITPDALPSRWENIPPVPAAAFKEAALCTFDPQRAELTFETSGTTAGSGGVHYMERAAVYDAALLAGFRNAMLRDNAVLRYLQLVPNPVERPRSSLGYMMARVAQAFGDGHERWYIQADELNVEAFLADVRGCIAEGIAVCLAGTAFGFVQLVDALAQRGLVHLPLPAGSRIMETGGFKGRTRVVGRGELYRSLADQFGVAQQCIVAEYGMTELTSQYYDATFGEVRIKRSPPWLRSRVVNATGETVAPGIVGALVHVDLANRSSCIAVQTEDLGIAADDGIILLGREQGAQLRGCSLDAEELRALARA
jgi:hypothetical protein